MSHDNIAGAVFDETIGSINEGAIFKKTRSVSAWRASKRLRLIVVTLKDFQYMKQNAKPKVNPKSNNSFCSIRANEETHTLEVVDSGKTLDWVSAPDSSLTKEVLRDDSLTEYGGILYSTACIAE